MATQQRNRIIYQSEALFVSPSSTGVHLQISDDNQLDVHGNTTWTGATGAAIVASQNIRSLTMPLERVQSANFNVGINRTDINELGVLARIDSIAMESPTIGLSFNYFLTDGGNERKLGFNVPTSAIASRDSAAYNTGDLAISGKSALSGLLDDNQGNNYFIVVSKEGLDVHNDTVTSATADFDVISIGNGFISDYSVEASVGAIPSASVTVEAFNIKADDRISGGAIYSSGPAPVIPAVDAEDGTFYNGTTSVSKQFFMQGTESITASALNTTGSNGTPSALRPGDITLSIGNAANYQGLTDLVDDGEAHIQSFNISVPMSRTVLQRLGNTFGYARVVDLPLNIDISMSVIVSELKTNNMYDALCQTEKHDFTLTLYGCDASTGGTSSTFKMKYIVKGARLEGEDFSQSIGDSETADITFSCQVGGANDTEHGLFIDGSYNLFRCLPFYPLGSNKDDSSSYDG